MSKSSLSSDLHKLSPAEFQFYTCTAGFLLSLPVYLGFVNLSQLLETKIQTVIIMLLNGILFHFQTMMAWILMEFLSPVTHSVCNTVKCALAVWISVPIFGNQVTLFSALGSFIVIIGVMLYNRACNYEQLLRTSLPPPSSSSLSLQPSVVLSDSSVNCVSTDSMHVCVHEEISSHRIQKL